MTGAFGVFSNPSDADITITVGLEPVGRDDGDPRGRRQGRRDGDAAQGGRPGRAGRGYG